MTSLNNSIASGFSQTIKIRETKMQPLDTVQCIVMDPYHANDYGFVTGGWDGCLRYYQIIQKNYEEIQLLFQRFLEHPIISVCFIDDLLVIAGLCTGDLVAVNMKDNQLGLIGSHEAMICKVFFIRQHNLIVSLGFDNYMRFWTLNNGNNFLAKQYKLDYKTHTACYDHPYLFIGTADGKLAMLNMNQLPNLKIPSLNDCYQLMEIGSKFLCADVNASLKFFVFCCADGRCFISQFDDNYNGLRPTLDSNKRLITKSMNKQTYVTGNTKLYGQVNDVDIGQCRGQLYLVIAGTEQVSFFNIVKKDKPKRIKRKGTAGSLSLDGRYYIWAEGNDWNEGIYDLKHKTKPNIQAVKFTESEVESFITDKK